MRKIYTFSTVVMNGTVMMNSDVAAFSTRELAEQTRLDVIEANEKDDVLTPLIVHCTDVEETVVYEMKEEIPFYREEKK